METQAAPEHKPLFPERETSINVLDKGYVRLVDHMGTDLNVVNAARASFQKEANELTPKDARLIKFLANEGHWSVFRHCFATIEVKAPLEVARQWWKYVVGQAQTDSFSTAWNEASRRYVTLDTEYYCPKHNEWRSAPDNKKQGSGGPLGTFEGEMLTQALEEYQREGAQLYKWAMEMNVAPEVARLFIPAYGMYTVWRWSSSIQGFAFFLNQRMEEEGPQSEIRDYARAVYKLVQPLWPVSIGHLVSLGEN